ncbi:hypothetical protein FCM35_KLT07016 [Carex littledalei]|uniref:Uncharacterized protein n=1 Tax=Carex littledalei TaxID=544730 RepID=A0A833VIZ4_9POAL|nr:hypothetical protein FCM35_KLT07016 [Carex littledalei]
MRYLCRYQYLYESIRSCNGIALTAPCVATKFVSPKCPQWSLQIFVLESHFWVAFHLPYQVMNPCYIIKQKRKKDHIVWGLVVFSYLNYDCSNGGSRGSS